MTDSPTFEFRLPPSWFELPTSPSMTKLALAARFRPVRDQVPRSEAKAFRRSMTAAIDRRRPDGIVFLGVVVEVHDLPAAEAERPGAIHAVAAGRPSLLAITVVITGHRSDGHGPPAVSEVDRLLATRAGADLEAISTDVVTIDDVPAGPTRHRGAIRAGDQRQDQFAIAVPGGMLVAEFTTFTPHLAGPVHDTFMAIVRDITIETAT